MAPKHNQDYSENNISVLEGLEPVRVRPGMYIGSTSRKGLNHLIYEIVDNSVDEHLAGYCDTIHVTLEKKITDVVFRLVTISSVFLQSVSSSQPYMRVVSSIIMHIKHPVVCMV